MTATGPRRWIGLTLVLAVLVAGSGASWLAMLEVRQVQQRHAALLMDHNADAIQRAVENEAARYLETLADMTASVGAQTSFNSADFDAITSRLSRDRLPGASAVGFVVSSRAGQTAATQSFWQRRGAAGLRLRPVGDAPEHLYLIFGRALDHADTDLGRDYSEASEPSTTMRQARVRGEVTASKPYVLLKDRKLPVSRRQRSVMLAAPVTGADGTPAAGRFLGWMVLMMRGGDFIDETLRAYAGKLVEVTLSGRDGGRSIKVATTTMLVPSLRAPALSRVRTLLVGARQWRLTVAPTTRLISDNDRRLPLATLGIGLLVTVLAGVLADSRRRALKRVAQATAALRHDIERRKEIEIRLLEREDELRHLALHDSLTSLPNRTLFHERLDQALGGPLAVLFIDLDGFKAVNDGLGHRAGDRLLVGAALRLTECSRAGDTVARLGGDEFAILALGDPDTTLADRVVSALNRPFDIDGQPVTISCSVGVAIAGDDADTAEHLIHAADEAMYAAKAAGKNRYAQAVIEPAAPAR